MKFLPLILLLGISLSINAQHGSNQLGAKPASLGYATATIADRWTVFNNPGGMGSLTETSAFAAFENRFGIEGLNSVGAGFITKITTGNLGVGLFRFGDALYNEQIISGLYSNKFGIASLGLRVNYLQYNIEGFGTQGLVTIDFGGLAQITDQISFGAYVRNINQARVDEVTNERTPTIFYAGLGFKPIDKLFISVETEKDIDNPALLKAGLEYQFLPKFYARTGIRTNELVNYFGLGFINQRIVIDYALTWDSTLGVNHQAAISYLFKK